MQNTLLDILILGLLVLLFGSIYRTQRSHRLRYWVAGWLFILAHFAFALPNPASNLLSNLADAMAISALVLGGLCFLLAASGACLAAGPKIQMQAELAIPVVAYVVAATFPVASVLLPALFVLVEYAVLSFAFRCWRQSRGIIIVSVACTAVAAVWAGHDIFTNQEIAGVNAILTQVYLMNAIVYWHAFRRRSMGVITASVGLVAWGAVFPVATAISAFLPHLQLSPELWNLPKYFVEFGMILTLVEDDGIETARQREEYRLLFEGNPHPMWIFDQETLDFLKVNAAAVNHYGYSQREFLGKNLRDTHPEEEVARLEHRLKEAGDETLHSGPWTHICKDGSRIQVEIASQAIQFNGRRARFSLVHDITERQQLYERLLYQAHHDILTGLPNRLLLKDRMTQMLANSERLGQKAAILCMDLDHFKQVNDTYGHHVGDICLQEVAVCLRDRLRISDTIARSGGEEFIVLLGQMKSPADAARVAQVLLDGFRQSLMIEGHTINLTASLGIAMYPTDGSSAHDLWRLADSAMYRAKHAGGNQYVFASNEGPALDSEAELEIDRVLVDGAVEDQPPRD